MDIDSFASITLFFFSVRFIHDFSIVVGFIFYRFVLLAMPDNHWISFALIVRHQRNWTFLKTKFTFCCLFLPLLNKRRKKRKSKSWDQGNEEMKIILMYTYVLAPIKILLNTFTKRKQKKTKNQRKLFMHVNKYDLLLYCITNKIWRGK